MNQGTITVTYKLNKGNFDAELDSSRKKMQQFSEDAAKATGNISDGAEEGAGRFSGVMGRIADIAKKGGLAIAAGIGVGAIGIGALTKNALLAGAELEQQLGGAEAVFGEYADGIKSSAKSAYYLAGLSQAEFLQGANKMGSLFQGAGFDVQSSMKMSSDSMQRASDIASIMGISTTDALEAVTGMAKGNFTMMDNLGVAMNDTAIGAYAASKGIDKSTAAMSIQEKVGLAQQMFMEKTAKYAGNYAKENETLAGSINSTKKAFDNLLSGQGDIDGFLKLLVSTIEIAVPQIQKILPQIVTAVGAIISSVVPALTAALPVLLPALIAATVGLLNQLVASMPQIMSALMAALPQFIEAFVQIFMAIVTAAPQIIAAVTPLIPQVVNSMVAELTKPESLMAIIQAAIMLLMAVFQALPVIIQAVWSAIPTIVDNIFKALTSPNAIKMMLDGAFQLLGAIIKVFVSGVGSVTSAALGVLGAITGVLSPTKLAEIGGNLIKGLWNGISNLSKWVTDKIKGFSEGVLKGIKDFFGIHSPSRVMAKMGGYIGEGFANGIEASSSIVAGAVDAMNNAVTGNMMTDISPSISATGSYAYGGVGFTPEDVYPSGGYGNPAVAATPQVVQQNYLTNGVTVDQVNRSLARQLRGV